jgi:hypothetical protein
VYEDQDRYEPVSIRRELPLEWAVGYLFGVWGTGPQMVPCPLPGHEDSMPSFNLWAEDEDGFPIRFGCFGCGANGDVIDAIRVARGVGFLEACRIAVNELIPAMRDSGWTPAERVGGPVRAAATSEALELVLDRITHGPEGFGLERFLERKGLDGLYDYVTTDWSWGEFATPAPVVFFPHRDWDGELTGIRYRSVRKDSTRWTELGSRFPALYGAWRDKGRPAVLLCEGETDTVWAAWQLRERPVDVLGLPAGAAQKPPAGAVRRLDGRTVWLAFDADIAGRIATARWLEALQPAAGGVRIVQLPEGEDVLSCGIAIRELMKQAVAV